MKKDHVSAGGEETRKRIVEFIQLYSKEHGYAPTFREIMRSAYISTTSGVHFHLRKLERMGCITLTPNTARTLRVTTDGFNHYLSGN